MRYGYVGSNVIHIDRLLYKADELRQAASQLP